SYAGSAHTIGQDNRSPGIGRTGIIDPDAVINTGSKTHQLDRSGTGKAQGTFKYAVMLVGNLRKAAVYKYTAQLNHTVCCITTGRIGSSSAGDRYARCSTRYGLCEHRIGITHLRCYYKDIGIGACCEPGYGNLLVDICIQRTMLRTVIPDII